MASPHIIIIGGGLSGAALANGLAKRNISYHVRQLSLSQIMVGISYWHSQVYEREPQVAQGLGYSIRMGQVAIDALKKCMDEEAYASLRKTYAKGR